MVQPFDVYLLGHPFEIVTDHSGFTYLTTIQHGDKIKAFQIGSSTSAIQRHHAGKSHNNADGLIVLTPPLAWPQKKGMGVLGPPNPHDLITTATIRLISYYLKQSIHHLIFDHYKKGLEFT